MTKDSEANVCYLNHLLHFVIIWQHRKYVSVFSEDFDKKYQLRDTSLCVILDTRCSCNKLTLLEHRTAI